MATNLSIDPELIERALKVSGERTKKAAVTKALQEFIARRAILDRFSALPLVVPDRQDHVEAAELRNHCRRRGVQIGTIDALLARLCIRDELMVLTTDEDFRRVARLSALRLWRA